MDVNIKITLIENDKKKQRKYKESQLGFGIR